jgi:prophage regulatory protein
MSEYESTEERPPRLLRLRVVLDRTGLARSTLYRGVANKTFPPPRKLEDDGRAVAWLESEVSEWISGRPYAVIKHAESANS